MLDGRRKRGDLPPEEPRHCCRVYTILQNRICKIKSSNERNDVNATLIAKSFRSSVDKFVILILNRTI